MELVGHDDEYATQGDRQQERHQFAHGARIRAMNSTDFPRDKPGRPPGKGGGILPDFASLVKGISGAPGNPRKQDIAKQGTAVVPSVDQRWLPTQ